MGTHLISIHEIERYLPKYLTPDSKEQLFTSLKQFPANYEKVFYSEQVKRESVLLQGDGVSGLPYFNYKTSLQKDISALVVSNSCDISPENKRLFSSHVVFTPIIKLNNVVDNLIAKGIPQTQVDELVRKIREQKITQIFYLPKGNDLEEEHIVFFDRVQNISLEDFSIEDMSDRKLFSLSNTGFYVFIVKLSIHFTRVQENVDRPSVKG